MNDRVERLGRAVALLGRAFGKEVDDLFLEAYRIGLEGVPIEMIERGVREALQTGKFMPSPAEIAGRVSLRRPGRTTCAACDIRLSFPESVQRGYCMQHWRNIGGFEEDERLEALEAPKDSVRLLPGEQGEIAP